MVRQGISKAIAAAVALAWAAVPVAAQDVTSCQDAGLMLNSVTALRPFANGGVKLFTIEREEPAASPMGIAVTIDRGEDLATAESFCRYVGQLGAADVAAAKASYDTKKALLTVVVSVRTYDSGTDSFKDGSLTLVIDKGAKSPEGLVAATLR